MTCPKCNKSMTYRDQGYVAHGWYCECGQHTKCDKECCQCQRCGSHLKGVPRGKGPYIDILCTDSTCGFAAHWQHCKAGLNSHPEYPTSSCVCPERK